MLDTTKIYTLVDKKHIPLEQSAGAYCCDNCGKLIANIAVLKHNTDIFNVGMDCLENILKNNLILSQTDIKDIEAYKKMIPKVLRFAKQLKELIQLNNGLDGFKFEKPTIFAGDGWITYWLLKGNQKPYNTNVKIKDMDFNFLTDTLKHIFPNLKIEIC